MASLNVSKLQAQAGDDAMLICTGGDFSWISQSVFMETGKFQYLEEPADAPQTPHEIDCSFSFLADNQSSYTDFNRLDLSEVSYQHFTSRLNQRPYTAFPYQQSYSRAPPIISHLS